MTTVRIKRVPYGSRAGPTSKTDTVPANQWVSAAQSYLPAALRVPVPDHSALVGGVVHRHVVFIYRHSW